MIDTRRAILAASALFLSVGLAGCGGEPAVDTKAKPSEEITADPGGKAAPSGEPREPLIEPSPVPKLPDPGKPAAASSELMPAPAGEMKKDEPPK